MILFKQITQTYRAVLLELFWIMPASGSNCPPRLVRQCYQSACLFWKNSKRYVDSYWEICNYFIYFFHVKNVRRENNFL